MALLFTGCETAPQGHSQVTVLPSDRQRKAITPATWTAEAERWLGVKYRQGGMGRGGIDDPGLISQMYLAVAGVALPRTVQEQSRYGKAVARNDLRPGDLVFFITLRQRTVEHVGIYLGDTRFVHASPSKGVVISSLLQDYYLQRYHSARRVIGQE